MLSSRPWAKPRMMPSGLLNSCAIDAVSSPTATNRPEAKSCCSNCCAWLRRCSSLFRSATSARMRSANWPISLAIACTVFRTSSLGARTVVLKNSITPKTSLRNFIGKPKTARTFSSTEICNVLASLTMSEIQIGFSLCHTRPGSPMPRGSAGRASQPARSFIGSRQVFKHSSIWLCLSTSQNVAASQSSPAPMISIIFPHALSGVSDSASTSDTWCSVASRRADCLRWLMSRLHSKII